LELKRCRTLLTPVPQESRELSRDVSHRDGANDEPPPLYLARHNGVNWRQHSVIDKQCYGVHFDGL
jgi:hypothetical protein